MWKLECGMPKTKDEKQNRKETLKMATDSHRKTQT